MLNRFLSTFGALAIFSLLIGFGAREPSPTRELAKSISEIPITHHFSQLVATVGTFQQGNLPPPLTTVVPAAGGLAISQIRAVGGHQYSGTIIIKVNGTVAFKAFLPLGFTQTYADAAVITPPLILAPGAVVEVGNEGGGGSSFSSWVDLVVTGYTLEPAYFGG
jgi:hypothetical protein